MKIENNLIQKIEYYCFMIKFNKSSQHEISSYFFAWKWGEHLDVRNIKQQEAEETV
jgi:hypothetical protein